MGRKKGKLNKDAMILLRVYPIEKEQFQQIAQELIVRKLIPEKSMNDILRNLLLTWTEVQRRKLETLSKLMEEGIKKE